MTLLIGGVAYRLIFGSDVINDGRFLELQDEKLPGHGVVLAAFHSDATGEITITACRESIPLNVVVQFIEAVRSEWPTSPPPPGN